MPQILTRFIQWFTYCFLKVDCDETKRAVLGDILYQIRFPTMGLEEFGKHVADSEILSSKEARQLFKLFCGGAPSKDLLFKTEKRRALYDYDNDPEKFWNLPLKEQVF